jgi:alkaline phosphatase D
MRGYQAMHQTRPDFFIHSGDTIYADGPIAATVTERDGQVWRNIVTEEVSKVAETLKEFRGRHRYNSAAATSPLASTGRSPAVRSWTSSAWTCARSSPRTPMARNRMPPTSWARNRWIG